MAEAAMLGRSSQAVRVPRKVFQQWPLLDEAGKVLSARPLFPELGGGPGHVVATSSRNKAAAANSFSVISLTCIRSGFCGRQWKSKDQMLIWLLIPWQDTDGGEQVQADLNLVLMPWLHVRIHICAMYYWMTQMVKSMQRDHLGSWCMRARMIRRFSDDDDDDDDANITMPDYEELAARSALLAPGSKEDARESLRIVARAEQAATESQGKTQEVMETVEQMDRLRLAATVGAGSTVAENVAAGSFSAEADAEM